MKSCISTYSYFKLYQTGEFTHIDAINKTKELGCEGVEFVLDDNPPKANPRDFALELTEHAKKIGLETPIYTTNANFFIPEPEKEVERVCKHIDIAAECGIPLLRHDAAWGYYEGYNGIKNYRKVIEHIAPYISKVADYAASKGIITCTENHGRLLQDSERMTELFLTVDNPNYRFLCDVGNFGGVDENNITACSKLFDLIVHVHAKDNFTRSGMSYNPGRGFNLSRGGNYRRGTIFGHGDVATFQILNAIRNSGYNGFVSLEFEGMEETMEAVTIGTENLQRMIKDIEGK